jgi:glycosyltransferase involved in cell wall biosynthesis
VTRKILSIGHSYVVGVNRRLVNEIARISDGKWEVHVVTPSKLNNDFRYFEYHPDSTDMCTISAIPVYCDRPLHIMSYDWKLADILRNNWDIVHCWEEPYVVSGAQIAYLTPKTAKLVYYSCQNIVKQYPLPFSWLENYSLGKADALVGIGKTVIEAWQTKLAKKQFDKPLVSIPLGVDLSLFEHNPDARSKIDPILNWSNSSALTIGYLGRLSTDKGLPLLLKVLDKLTDTNVNWRCLIVGKGPMENELNEWAKTYPDRVRILTNVTHESVPNYLNSMDMLVAPSQTRPNWREQQGRMLIEAMACNVPIIASDSGEIPNVVGDAGIIVGEDDLEGWVTAIQQTIDSPSQRKQLIELGSERAKTQFSWSVVARQKIDLFESLYN